METQKTACLRQAPGNADIGLRLLLATVAALIAFTVQAKDVLTPTAHFIEVEAQSCHLQCGTTLSVCEHGRSKGKHCPREFQQCKENCDSARRGVPVSIKSKKQLCEQRCETSASLCSQDRAQNAEACSAGQSQCRARCR